MTKSVGSLQTLIVRVLEETGAGCLLSFPQGKFVWVVPSPQGLSHDRTPGSFPVTSPEVELMGGTAQEASWGRLVCSQGVEEPVRPKGMGSAGQGVGRAAEGPGGPQSHL